MTARNLNEREVDRIYEWARRAYLKARLAKRHTTDEQSFEMNAPVLLADLAEDIARRSYSPSRGIAFITFNPVIREIFAAPFRDRVVHHMLYDLVADWWDRRFIYDNYSCRVGKGTLFGIRRLHHHIMSVSQNGRREAWVLKLDVRGYFMSMPRRKLYERAIWGLDRQFNRGSWEHDVGSFLWRQIIFDDPVKGVKIRAPENWKNLPKSKSLFHAKEGCGIVIGNLTSQLLSNIYLDQLDRFVKFELGCKHYGRYVDDFYFVGESHDELAAYVEKVRDFLRGIGLVMHPKKIFLQKAERGVPFLGVVVYPWRIQVGERCRKRMLRAEDEESIISYKGLTMWYKHEKLWSQMDSRPRGDSNN